MNQKGRVEDRWKIFQEKVKWSDEQKNIRFRIVEIFSDLMVKENIKKCEEIGLPTISTSSKYLTRKLITFKKIIHHEGGRNIITHYYIVFYVYS